MCRNRRLCCPSLQAAANGGHPDVCGAGPQHRAHERAAGGLAGHPDRGSSKVSLLPHIARYAYCRSPAALHWAHGSASHPLQHPQPCPAQFLSDHPHLLTPEGAPELGAKLRLFASWRLPPPMCPLLLARCPALLRESEDQLQVGRGDACYKLLAISLWTVFGWPLLDVGEHASCRWVKAVHCWLPHCWQSCSGLVLDGRWCRRGRVGCRWVQAVHTSSALHLVPNHAMRLAGCAPLPKRWWTLALAAPSTAQSSESMLRSAGCGGHLPWLRHHLARPARCAAGLPTRAARRVSREYLASQGWPANACYPAVGHQCPHMHPPTNPCSNSRYSTNIVRLTLKLLADFEIDFGRVSSRAARPQTPRLTGAVWSCGPALSVTVCWMAPNPCAHSSLLAQVVRCPCAQPAAPFPNLSLPAVSIQPALV